MDFTNGERRLPHHLVGNILESIRLLQLPTKDTKGNKGGENLDEKNL
jgi:hypothetical protein